LERQRSAQGARSGFAASSAQKAAMEGECCLVCWQLPVDPAHLIDKSVAPDPSGDPLRVVPLCRRHHDEYDSRDLNLLPYLLPSWRQQLGLAVQVHPGAIVGALNRITGEVWAPVAQAPEPSGVAMLDA